MIAGEFAGDDVMIAETTLQIDQLTGEDRASHASSITLEDALTYG